MEQIARLLWSELPATPGVGADAYWHLHQGDYVPHDHDFFEIAVVLGGSGSHEVSHRRSAIGAGDAFTIRPGSWHAFLGCDDLLVASCCVHTRLLERELLWLAEEPRLRLLLWPGSTNAAGILHVSLAPAQMRTCDAALRRLAAPPHGATMAYRVGNLLLALQALGDALDSSQLAEAERLCAAPTAVLRALNLLEADLARSWTLGKLATEVALSPSYLSRRFRAAVGRSPMAHLAKLRAEAAAVRLRRGGEPVAEVGAAVGWGDPNYFSRRFRAHFGQSPTAFRAAGPRSASHSTP